MIIAIDGPAASGKSTVARGVAGALALPYLDTGSLYRAIAWAVLAAGVDPTDPHACTSIAERVEVTVLGPGLIAVDGRDVSSAIRGFDVDAAVSAVAGHPGVRARLLDLQRAFPGDAGAVIEGRDIGRVIFPCAEVKVYLDADPAERARRRSDQVGNGAGDALRPRDDGDAPRMLIAPGAVVIDTTKLDARAVIERILRLAR